MEVTDITTKKSFGWRILGETVRGASHERSGMPNQDAIRCYPEADGNTLQQLPIIMTVSDGHGGSKYFRSDVGSLLAADTAGNVIRDFLEGQSGVNNLSVIKKSTDEWLPKALVRSWLEAVENHIKENPLSDEDLLALENKHGTDVRRSAETNLQIAYGATLLIAVITEEFSLFLQLGDGDILAVSSEGEVYRPLPDDERLFGNETTSLCSPNPWRDFRINFQPVSSEHPSLLLLSTDGYANCFRDEAGFRKVATDIYQMIRSDGIDYVNSNLESWLVDASQTGSGDDITVGLICNVKSLERAAELEAVTVFTADETISTKEIENSAAGSVETTNPLSVSEKDIEITNPGQALIEST